MISQCLADLRLRQIIIIDKSQYFAQPHSIIVNFFSSNVDFARFKAFTDYVAFGYIRIIMRPLTTVKRI